MVLMINTALKSQEAQRLWALPGWLPEEIGIMVEGGQFNCFEGEDLRLHLQRNMDVIVVYELVGLVADINSGEHQKSHLVSLINGEHSSNLSPSAPPNCSQLRYQSGRLKRRANGIFSMTFLSGRCRKRRLCASRLRGKYHLSWLIRSSLRAMPSTILGKRIWIQGCFITTGLKSKYIFDSMFSFTNMQKQPTTKKEPCPDGTR